MGLTFSIAMPPRTATVADGELKTIGVFLEIFPPTRRNIPLLTLITNSPVPVSGSNTYSSIVISELEPTVKDVPSRNSNWALPEGLVSIFSLKNTSRPVSRFRAGEIGGLPTALVTEAAVTPTSISSVAARATPAEQKVTTMISPFSELKLSSGFIGDT